LAISDGNDGVKETGNSQENYRYHVMDACEHVLIDRAPALSPSLCLTLIQPVSKSSQDFPLPPLGVSCERAETSNRSFNVVDEMGEI
jgi:hypothetical protein